MTPPSPEQIPSYSPGPRPESLRETDEMLRTYLTEADWLETLERIMDQTPETTVSHDRREGGERHERWVNCLLRIERDGQEPAIFVVRTRNISNGGIAILHGGLIQVGTPCVVALEAKSGQGLIQRAKVVWSRPIDRDDPTHTAYEMGLQFDSQIDSALFLEN